MPLEPRKQGLPRGPDLELVEISGQTNRKFNWRLSNLGIDPKMCFLWFWSFDSDIYWLPLSSHSVCWSSRTSCHPFQEVLTGSVLTSHQYPTSVTSLPSVIVGLPDKRHKQSTQVSMSEHWSFLQVGTKMSIPWKPGKHALSDRSIWLTVGVGVSTQRVRLVLNSQNYQM